MPFRERLRQEFESRRKKNPRYSMRALALFLETDHSTLAQILRGSRRIPVSRMRAWARKLRIGTEEMAVYIAAEHAPDAQTAQRQHQSRHWTAEASALLPNLRTGKFCDCPALANSKPTAAGLPDRSAPAWMM